MGGAGDDFLDGGNGEDILFGGPGTDVLVNGELNFPDLTGGGPQALSAHGLFA
jgi:Ca2+-binding RTX toxin-like protein